MTLPVEISSRVSTPDLFIAKQPVNLLKVALKHARTGIISRLLEQHPNLMSDDHSPLTKSHILQQQPSPESSTRVYAAQLARPAD